MNSPHQLITSRSEFQDALRGAFAEMAHVGAREVWICDDDFADWPLNERAVVDHLAKWAYAHRKLTVVARTFEEVTRRHPRWVEWRRQWSHVVECRSVEEALPGDLPATLLAPGLVVVRLFDAVHIRGSVSRDVADAVQSREMIDAVLQRSAEAFPATTTGL